MIGSTTYYRIGGSGEQKDCPPFCYAYPSRAEAETAASAWLAERGAEILIKRAKWEMAQHVGLDTARHWEELVHVRLAGPIEEFTAYEDSPAIRARVECMVLERRVRQEPGPHGVSVSVETVAERIAWTGIWPRRPYDSKDRPIVASEWLGIREERLLHPRPDGAPRVWSVSWGVPLTTPLPACTETMVVWWSSRGRAGGTVTAMCIGDSPAEVLAAIPPAKEDWWCRDSTEVPWQWWDAVQCQRPVAAP